MFDLKDSPNIPTFEAFCKCSRYIQLHNNILVSLSGGADSDVMLDLMYRVAQKENILLDKFTFVFFDTGIEYQATKDHLEKKYNIKIERMRALKPVPVGCKLYGLPFLSKYVSEMIERLQRHNFEFKDEPYEILIEKYPKCKIALKWWCNQHQTINGRTSRFNIDYNKHLKEFMILNPPTFRISNKCCKGAKKDNAHKILKERNIDLNCVGIRKAEGGARSTAYSSCFSDNRSFEINKNTKSYDDYRPIFWFTDKDKKSMRNVLISNIVIVIVNMGLKELGV